MRTIDNIEFEVNRWEVVECVDYSVRAAAKHTRGFGEQETQLIWKTDLRHNQITPKLRLILRDPDGELLLKFVLRGHFTVLGTDEIMETKHMIEMPKAAALAIAHEVWDYAMDYLSKRSTPISTVSIPRPPDERLVSELKLPSVN